MCGKALSPWWSPPQEWDLPFEQTDSVWEREEREREREISDSEPDRHLPANLPSSAPSQKAEQRRCWCCAFCRALSVSAAQLPSLSLRSPFPLCLKNTPCNHTERLFAVIMSLAVQFTAEARQVWPWSGVLHLAVVFGGISLPFTQVGSTWDIRCDAERGKLCTGCWLRIYPMGKEAL